MASMGVSTFTSTSRRRADTWAEPISSRETCSSGCTAAGAGAAGTPASSSSRIFLARRSTGSGTPASLATSMP